MSKEAGQPLSDCHTNYRNNQVSLAHKYDTLKSKFHKLQKENVDLRTNNHPQVMHTKEDDARLTYLRGKLEDLEQVHKEGKAKHRADINALKTELEQSRKVISDQSQQLGRVKRQCETLEAQLFDMKKVGSKDQAETRELLSKLRLVEKDRDRLLEKQSEAAGLRRALIATESKGKGDLHGKEREIKENQRMLADERKKVLNAEEKIRELAGRAEIDAKEHERKEKALERELLDAEGRTKDANLRCAAAEDLKETQLALLNQENSRLKMLVAGVTEQYSILASTTVLKATHETRSTEALELQSEVSRLQRQLGDMTDEVENLEFTNQHLLSRNEWLENELQDASETVRSLSSTSLAESREHASEVLLTFHDNDSDDEVEFFRSLEAAHTDALKSLLALNSINAEDMLSCIRVTGHELAAAEDLNREAKTEMARTQDHNSQISSVLAATRCENANLIEQLAERCSTVSSFKELVREKDRELVRCEDRRRAEQTEQEERLTRERELRYQLQETVQRLGVAEDAMRDDILHLAEELEIAGSYRRAYEAIVVEMKDIIARNNLAEEEADRLSKFNAEILGHQNPGQKICYVDRIRRELADTKQKLLSITRDAEEAAVIQNTLESELRLYRSVAVPLDGKPRSNMTRVRRIPLGALTRRPPIEKIARQCGSDGDPELATHD